MKKKLLSVAVAAMLALSLGTVAFAASSQQAHDVTPGEITTAPNSNVAPEVEGGTATGLTPAAEDMNAIKDKAASTIKTAEGAPEVLKTFELTATANQAVTIQLGKTIDAARNLVVLHQNASGAWESMTFTWGSADNKSLRNCITVQWPSYSPVAIVEYKPVSATPSNPSTDGGAKDNGGDVPPSPQTGAEFPMAAVVALAAMAGAAVCVKKFAVKE